MPESPRDPGRDRGAIPPPRERLASIENDLANEFPTLTRSQINTALETSRAAAVASVEVDDLASRARQRLRALIAQDKNVPRVEPLSSQPLTHPGNDGPGRSTATS